MQFTITEDSKKINNWHSFHDEVHARYGCDWNPYYRFISCFPHIARDAQMFGIEIINANPNSAIDVFPKMTIEEALCLK